MARRVEVVLRAKREARLNIRKVFLMFCTLGVYTLPSLATAATTALLLSGNVPIEHGSPALFQESYRPVGFHLNPSLAPRLVKSNGPALLTTRLAAAPPGLERDPTGR